MHCKMRKIYSCDCLAAMEKMEYFKIFVDLIYLDPPYRSGRAYYIKANDNGKKSKELAFNDTWGNRDNDLQNYLNYMTERLEAMKKVLRPTGSIYLHCDPTVSHYLKIKMDEIFGIENFRNEIIWHYQTGGASKKRYAKKHDVILFYSKGKDYYFSPEKVMVKRTAKSLKRAENTKGARFCIDSDIGKYPMDVWQDIQALNMDVWTDIQALNPMAKERTGYPTQKPKALLKRIIKASCPTGGVVFDPFFGSGTTLKVAEELGMEWVGSDSSTGAFIIMQEFLDNIYYPL